MDALEAATVAWRTDVAHESGLGVRLEAGEKIHLGCPWMMVATFPSLDLQSSPASASAMIQSVRSASVFHSPGTG